MDDERLLSEALRAHASGGVSTPEEHPSPEPATEAGPSSEQRWPHRFRPTSASSAAPAPPAPGPTPGPPARPPSGPPGPGGRPGPRPSGAPGTPAGGWPAPRVGARPSGPAPAPGVPFPRTADRPATPPPGPAAPPAPIPAYAVWSSRRVAWWSAVALLSGAVAGALGAVVSLLVP